MRRTRQIAWLFLSVAPFLTVAMTAARGLRLPGVHQAVGAVVFTSFVLAMGLLGARHAFTRSSSDAARGLAAAGALLQLPFALVGLLWVGLGTPWQATPDDNLMRYMVLLTASIAVACGFVLLTDALRHAGERFYSTLGFAASLLAGSAYVVWMSFQIGVYLPAARQVEWSDALRAMNAVNDILLFVACALTYAATAAFAAALGRIRWLGPRTSSVYVALNLLALGLLILRGLSFPSATGAGGAWYTEPGFIVGIPAVPWILPALLGVVLLRRAGDEPIGAGAA